MNIKQLVESNTFDHNTHILIKWEDDFTIMNWSNIVSLDLDVDIKIGTEDYMVSLTLSHLPNDIGLHDGELVHVAECSHCGIKLPTSQLQRGVVDRESGVEWYCEDCADEVEFIVGNQELDEMEVE